MRETCFYHIFHLGLGLFPIRILIWLEQNILKFNFFLCHRRKYRQCFCPLIHALFASCAKSFCKKLYFVGSWHLQKKSLNILEGSVTNSLKFRWQRFQNKNKSLSDEKEMFLFLKIMRNQYQSIFNCKIIELERSHWTIFLLRLLLLFFCSCWTVTLMYGRAYIMYISKIKPDWSTFLI